MSTGMTITRTIHFTERRGRRKVLSQGPAPAPAAQPCGRVPRLARLMTLAIRMDGLVWSG